MRPRRKKTQSNTKAGSFNWFGLVILLVGLVAIGFWLYSQYLATKVERIVDEPIRFIIIQPGEDQSLQKVVTVHYLPDKEEVLVVELPPDLKIPVVGGYGMYRVESLLQLGELEGVGDKVLQRSLESLFGTPYNWIIYQQNTVEEPNFDWLVAELRAYLSTQKADHQAYYFIMEIWQEIKELSEVKVQVLDFADLRLLLEQDEVDGSQVALVDDLRLDSFISKAITPQLTNFAETGVVIQNATSHPGLAGYWSRFAVHSGFHLLSLGNAQDKLETSRLIFNSPELAETDSGLLLQQLYPFAEVSVAETSEYRSEVVLLLGEDAWLKLNSKAAFED